MAKREKRAHLSGVGCSIRAFCYGRRFVFASCGIICIYLTHVLWLMERYKQHDLIRNPPSHLHWHSSIERIQRRQNSIVAPNDVSMDDDNIHIVFSTGCNAFQDWQTYVLFHQLWRVGQTGHVTRIVSGCANKQEEESMRSIFNTQIRNGIPTGKNRFHLYITRDYSKEVPGVTYNPLNKPFGVLEWMENVLNMPESLSQYTATMFVILDPDQLVVRPFKARDFSTEIHASRWRTFNSNTYFEFNATHHVLKEGSPISQFYSIGVDWMQGVNSDVQRVVDAAWKAMDGNAAFTDTMRTSSHLYNWTNLDMWDYYSAGAPYIALGLDMYRITKVWAAVSVPVYELTTNPISEMYAYSTAAAHLSLPHDLSYHFMISNTGGTWLEAWNKIDEMAPNDVCQNTWSDWKDLKNVEYRKQLPYVIHYCQEYAHGPYYFFKYVMANDFLTCGHPLLVDPSEHDRNITDPQQSLLLFYTNTSLVTNSDFSSKSAVERKRNAFMLCHLIPRINEAATFWKKNHCTEGTANFKKVYTGFYFDVE